MKTQATTQASNASQTAATGAQLGEIVADLKKLEVSSAPADAMLDRYNAILAKAEGLPASAQWEVTYHSISVLTAIEAAQDAPAPIRALGRFMRRVIQLVGEGGVGSLLRRTIRGGPRLGSDAEVALAKLARAEDAAKMQSILQSSPELLPAGADALRVPLESGTLVLQPNGLGVGTRFEDAAGKDLGEAALHGALKSEAAMAQEFARTLRATIASVQS